MKSIGDIQHSPRTEFDLCVRQIHRNRPMVMYCRISNPYQDAFSYGYAA